MTSQSQDHSQLESQWLEIQITVPKLLRQEEITRREWQRLFWMIHNVCYWEDGAALKVHQHLHEEILNYIEQVQGRVKKCEEDSELLKTYLAEWTKFFNICDYLPKPFGDLETILAGKSNSSIQAKREGEENIRKLMLDSWNQSIFADIKNRLQCSVVKLVQAERNGAVINSQLVIGIRESHVNLSTDSDNIYKDNFEKAYVDATREYYQTKAPEYLSDNGVLNYMHYAAAKLKEEEIRAKRYLETRNGRTSINVLTECCVNVLTSFVVAECPSMIESNETEKLKLMFNLLDRVPDGIQPMLSDLEGVIFKACLTDMKASAETITTDSSKYVELLLQLFHRFSKLVKDLFPNDPRFLESRDKAYKHLVNDTSIFQLDSPVKNKGVGAKSHPESRCPELLAQYCDSVLRKTRYSENLTPEEVDCKMRNIITVLKYVSNRDVFIRFYKSHLTRRLLLNTSTDIEKEENMVESLKAIGMPSDFIQKMARMFQDMKISIGFCQDFKETYQIQNNTEGTAESINTKILNSGAWSQVGDRLTVTLPLELEEYIPKVEKLYTDTHCGRKLQWHHLMSNGTITFDNETGSYDLDVTTFQMSVLFALNERPNGQISYASLKLATNLPDTELRKTLWSLICYPKTKRQVLLCEPMAKSAEDFTDTSNFSINQAFGLFKNGKVQKTGRFSLIGPVQRATERRRDEKSEEDMQLRILRVQETIVQIMKRRKETTNVQLHADLVDSLKKMFLPSKKMIKEQIEWLIDNKYMKRDEENLAMFIYVTP